MTSCLIIGGTSAIAGKLIAALHPAVELMVITGRDWTPPPGVEHAHVELTSYDGRHTLHWRRRYSAVLCVAPIIHMPRFLPFLSDSDGARGVFLSSNNAALLPGNPDYAALREAEDAVRESALDTVILQPTAIDGRPGGPVLGRMVESIRAGKPIWLPGAETRQRPVDYRDVARAMIHGGDMALVEAGTYSVSGPDALTYAELVERAEAHTGQRARTRHLPASAARVAGAVLPAGAGSTAAALRRAGIHRDPVSPPLPGFAPRYGVDDMLRVLTRQDAIPS